MTTWQVHEAKARFSQLLREATTKGPQTVTKHGRPTVVVVSVEEYHGRVTQQPSLAEVIHSSPMAGVECAVERDRSQPGNVGLPEVAL